ncbi:MAG: S8 family serine peptidase, partial [Candidatus Altiarchaeota archaeon]|nr:S8 family serine peptidase [Candidatus Altiarchaeota archaeon]
MNRWVSVLLCVLLIPTWGDPLNLPLQTFNEPLVDDAFQVLAPPIRYKSQLDVSSSIINAINLTNELGFTGKGVRVAVIDSGIESSNPFFTTLVNEGRFFQYTCPGATGALVDHGTHVGGIIAGNYSNYLGISPGVTLLS